MRKVLLLLIFTALTATSKAQISFDLELDLLTPDYGDSLFTGALFDMTFELINNGPDTIPGGNTIHYRGTISGVPLGNFTYFVSPFLSPGSPITLTRSISIGGGQSGTATFCAEITNVSGSAAGGEQDSSNWKSCTQVGYKKVNVSTDDFYLMQPIDKSFVANQTLFINVEGISSSNHITYSVINIAGQNMLSGRVDTHNFSAKEEIQLPQLSSGIYILMLNDGQGFRSTKKVGVGR